MASRKNYYDILGVRRGATDEEIEKAYQKLARTYQYVPHPGNRTTGFGFKEILEAYEVLSNKSRRERYDRMGTEPRLQEDFWGENLEEIGEEEESSLEGFEDFFEERLGKGEPLVPHPPQKGKDLHYTLELDFESAVHGAVKEFGVLQEIPCLSCGTRGVNPKGPKKICDPCGGAGQVLVGLPPSAFSQECGRCQGEGKVLTQCCDFCSGKGWITQQKTISLQLPPGVNDGCRIYLPNMGHMGKGKGTRGDLVVHIQIRKHPFFQRKGDDVRIEVPLTLWEAVLGVEVEVPTLHGSIKIPLPPGIQPGEELRIPGRGVPFLQGGGRGDQVVTFRVIVPQELDEGSKRVLEELKQRNPEDPRQRCGWAFRSSEEKK